MEDPKITALKERLQQELLNPQFYHLTKQQQKEIISWYISNGVPKDYAVNMLTTLAQEQAIKPTIQPTPQQTVFIPSQQQVTPQQLEEPVNADYLIRMVGTIVNDPNNDNKPDLAKTIDSIRAALKLNYEQINTLIKGLWRRNSGSILQLIQVPNGVNIINVPHNPVGPNTQAGFRQEIMRKSYQERYIDELDNFLMSFGIQNLPNLAERLNGFRTALELAIPTFNELIRELWVGDPNSVVQLRGGGPGGVTTFTIATPNKNKNNNNITNEQSIKSRIISNQILLTNQIIPNNQFIPNNQSPLGGQNPVQPPSLGQGPRQISAHFADRLYTILNVPQSTHFHHANSLYRYYRIMANKMSNLTLEEFNQILSALYWLSPIRTVELTRTDGAYVLEINNTNNPVTQQDRDRTRSLYNGLLGDYVNNLDANGSLEEQARILNTYRQELSMNLDPDTFNKSISSVWRKNGNPVRLYIPPPNIRGPPLALWGIPRTVTNNMLAELLNTPIHDTQQVERITALDSASAAQLWRLIRDFQSPAIRARAEREQRQQPQQQREQPQQQREQQQRHVRLPGFLRNADRGLLSQVTNLLLQPFLDEDPDRTQFFDEMRSQLRLTDEQFNEYLQVIWPTQPAPVLSRNVLGGVRVTGANVSGISGQSSDSIYVGPREVIEELEGFVDNVILPIADKEVRLFGSQGILIGDLKIVFNRIINIIRGLRRRPTNWTRIELDTLLEDLLNDVNNISQQQILMGKRCINTETPIYQTPVDELEDDEFVRLDGGVCWENDELREFIKSRKGKNDLSNLKKYPSNSTKIWENDEDFNKILRMPGADQDAFSKWLKRVTSGALAERISLETLNRMYITASLLGSIGRPFRETLNKELQQAPNLLRVWREIGENAYNINSIADPTIRMELNRVIAEVLKSAAIAEFYEYYKSLSDDEKDALASYDPKLAEQLRKCHGAEECVFGVSNTLIALRNQIAIIKELPVIDLTND